MQTLALWRGITLGLLAVSAAPALGLETTVKTTAPSLEVLFDLRPTTEPRTNDVRMENEVSAGVRFAGRAWWAGYIQDILIQLPGSTSPSLNLATNDGFLKLERAPFASVAGATLGYEGRVYLPTNPADRAAGQLTQLWTMMKATRRLSSYFEVAAYSAPILYLYSRSGNVAADGTAAANKLAEHRLFLWANFYLLGDTLTLKIPLIWEAHRHGSFQAGARFDNGWSHKVWLYPELLYAWSPRTTVGVAWYSGNCVRDDGSASTVGDALRASAFQAVLQQSL